MIYINKIFERVNPEETYILMDFDRTLTMHDSAITWGVIEGSPLVDSNYTQEAKKLYKTYRKIEIDPILSFEAKSEHMQEWHKQGISLYRSYSINESLVKKILKADTTLNLRRDSAQFLHRMQQLKIPVVIVSAGLGTVIENVLKNHEIMYDNITILSNFFKFEEGNIVGFESLEIHALSKFLVEYEHIIRGRRKGLLFGDQVEDTYVSKSNDTIKIGFLDSNSHSIKVFKEYFDLILTDDSSFDSIGKILIKGYKKN